MNPMRDINKSSGVCEEKVWSGRLSETEPKILCISWSEIGVGLSPEPKKPLTFRIFLIEW
jgi:hypothetical protein